MVAGGGGASSAQMVGGGPVEVAECFSIDDAILLSRASLSSKAMMLYVMTCSRCSKNTSWYFV